MRATIVVDVEQAEELGAVEAWFARWEGQVHSRSEDRGCGCCIHMWDVDAPHAAIGELPDAVRAESDWALGAAWRRG
jgi:hypothetical protein